MDGDVMKEREKAEAALAIKQGQAPKSMLTDREIAGYYYNRTVAELEELSKPKPRRPKNATVKSKQKREKNEERRYT